MNCSNLALALNIFNYSLSKKKQKTSAAPFEDFFFVLLVSFFQISAQLVSLSLGATQDLKTLTVKEVKLDVGSALKVFLYGLRVRETIEVPRTFRL